MSTTAPGSGKATPTATGSTAPTIPDTAATVTPGTSTGRPNAEPPPSESARGAARAASPTGQGGRGSVLARWVAPQRSIGPVAGIVALVVVFLLLANGGFISTIFEDVLIFAIAAMGLDFLGGFGGLISLGQAGFLGVGAYGVVIAEVHGFGPWAAVGIAIGAVLAVGLVTGVVAVRVSGISFVIITLAIGQILWGLSYEWTGLTSGDNGIPLTSTPSIGPLNLSSDTTLHMVTLVVFLLSLALLLLFVRSPFGLSLRGLKSNEPRLRALGYRSGVQRYVGYLVSVFFAGLAGILYVFANHLMSPTTMDFSQDGFLVLMVVLGGLGSIWGPCLGAVVIVLFQQEISIYLARWETVMGLVFIAAVIFTPDGIWGLLLSARRLVLRGIDRISPPARRSPGAIGEPADMQETSAR